MVTHIVTQNTILLVTINQDTVTWTIHQYTFTQETVTQDNVTQIIGRYAIYQKTGQDISMHIIAQYTVVQKISLQTTILQKCVKQGCIELNSGKQDSIQKYFTAIKKYHVKKDHRNSLLFAYYLGLKLLHCPSLYYISCMCIIS